MPGLLAQKVGMTQVYSPTGTWMPVTVLKAGPCCVVSKRSPNSAGKAAIQLGFEEMKQSRQTKPYVGHFLKKNLAVYRYLKEIKTTNADAYGAGDFLTVSQFEQGDMIDVSGVSKGKGFQGVMKRHHFGGGRDSHGCSISHRSAGSIGQRTEPGKVFKGKKMAGRMGGKAISVKNLEVVGIEPEQNLILVKGAVPGPNSSLIVITPKTGAFEKRFIENKGKQQKQA